MALQDDITRLTREVWRLNLQVGFGSRIGLAIGPGFTPIDVHGRLAKASGATREQVEMWLSGRAEPTTQQALAVLTALPLPETGALSEPAAEMNGAGA